MIVPGPQLVVGAVSRDEMHSPSVQRCKQMPEALGCIKSVIVPGSQMVFYALSTQTKLGDS